MRDSTYFFLKDALGVLETPGGRSKPGPQVETPLTDVINRNLKVALANSSHSNVSEMEAASASPQLKKTTEKEVNWCTSVTFMFLKSYIQQVFSVQIYVRASLWTHTEYLFGYLITRNNHHVYVEGPTKGSRPSEWSCGLCGEETE